MAALNNCNYSTEKLFDSIRDDDAVTIQALLQEGVDVNARDSEGFTPLRRACYHGRKKLVSLLIKSGANVELAFLNEWPGLRQAALHIAITGRHLGIVKWLVENGININASDRFDATALHIASRNGSLEIVKWLVQEGAEINNRNFLGQTALHLASEERNPEIVKCLVEKGIEVNARSELGETALHLASLNGCLESVKCLVQQNCDLDVKNIWGSTALSNACEGRKLNIAQYLLQAGASWDTEDEDGISPLNYFTRFSALNCLVMEEELQFKFLKLFIENGAYLKCVDYEAMVKSSLLKSLQDVELCRQSIINKFNNKDLPELYKLPVSGCLPRIEQMKITSGTEVAQAIKRTVRLEIQRKGHCNILEVRPMMLSAFCVRSLLEYCETKTLELRNGLKRPAAFDPNNKYQPSSKVMC